MTSNDIFTLLLFQLHNTPRYQKYEISKLTPDQSHYGQMFAMSPHSYTLPIAHLMLKAYGWVVGTK